MSRLINTNNRLIKGVKTKKKDMTKINKLSDIYKNNR